MPQKGLLRRTLEVAHQLVAEEQNDRSSGITPEDRLEITEQINELTRKNRIVLTPERLLLKPLKKGFFFPLTVNLLALVITGGSLWGLSVAFSGRDREYSQTGAALASAEGKLLQELKKEAESRLSQKDKEISDFQSRLTSIEKNRNELQTSYEQKLSEMELKLRSQMETELKKERERLIAEGLSPAVIEERLKKFEKEKLAGINKELENYKRRLDEEKAASEAQYARLKQEYLDNISNLNDERKNLLKESQLREETLRASLDAKSKELDLKAAELAASAAEANAGLLQARTELEKIDAEKKSSAAAEDQIIGLYMSVRSALKDNRYKDAAEKAAALQSFLSEPAIVDVAPLQKRRPTDLYMAEILASLARSELDKANTDNSVLLQQAEMSASIISLASRAKTSLAAGKTEEAEALYKQALAVMPDVMAAHVYFVSRSTGITAEDRKMAEKSLTEAQKLLSRNNYSGASASFAAAALSFGLSDEDTRNLIDGVSLMAVNSAASEQKAADTKAAQALMTRAKREMDGKQWMVAVGTYTALLSEHPQAEQVSGALKGISGAFASLSKEAELKTLDSAKRIAELEKLVEQTRLATAKTAAADNTDPGSNASDLQATIDRLQAQNLKLNEATQNYDAMVAAYAAYQSAEDAALAGTGAKTAVLIQARTQLNAFLSEPATRTAFPDLKERIARYETSYIEAGQQSIIPNAQALVEQVLRQKDPAVRDKILQDVRARYKSNAGMLSFIDALQRGLKQ